MIVVDDLQPEIVIPVSLEECTEMRELDTEIRCMNCEYRKCVVGYCKIRERFEDGR